jgi:poly(beta-D-mannuronate) lyase
MTPVYAQPPSFDAVINRVHSRAATPLIPAPTGRMNIPSHYLFGSNGPVNPAGAVTIRVYGMFESRITAGMNQ